MLLEGLISLKAQLSKMGTPFPWWRELSRLHYERIDHMSEESLAGTLDKMVSLLSNEALSRGVSFEKFMCESHICKGTEQGHLIIVFESQDPAIKLLFNWYPTTGDSPQAMLSKFEATFDQLFKARDEMLKRTAGLAGLN